jgi:hypothetical protein
MSVDLDHYVLVQSTYTFTGLSGMRNFSACLKRGTISNTANSQLRSPKVEVTVF